MTRLQLLIKGQVQGVGFRPHVYRIAKGLGLTGWVQNHLDGVLVEIQGNAANGFLDTLKQNLPQLAEIHSIESTPLPPLQSETTFQIIKSQSGSANTLIAPDIAICPACLDELFDENSRYYAYPFLNCTACGPRVTIIKKLPYDRAHTSMADFALCQDCQKDYEDPSNRRYHAEPSACNKCGPRLSSTIKEIAEALLAGKIVAIKGIGGYQLFSDPYSEPAVAKLRKIKQREAKPFALMLLNEQSVGELVDLPHEARDLLISKERPIVLLDKKDRLTFASIAPGLSCLGIMLPSTPAHYLLFHALLGSPKGQDWLNESHSVALVATSANRGGEPLIIDDQEAHSVLNDSVDLVVSYNREIVRRLDDSVIRWMATGPSFIRRARGYVPKPIKLAYPISSTLALGGALKNTICVTREDEAFVSQHIGDMSHPSTIDFLENSVAEWCHFLNVSPKRVACDAHPDFYTTRMAEALALPLVKVQHHHAHLASVAAEHHLLEPVLGLALDGYGYGLDGGAWGGELCYLSGASFERLASLSPLPLPGGDRASREPWRMAAAVLHCLGKAEEIESRFSNHPMAAMVAQLLNGDLPLTSSCGRWFDAASALLGVNFLSLYEGQAAMMLESLVTHPMVLPNGWLIEDNSLNLLPLFSHLLDKKPEEGANIFHGTLIEGLVDWVVYWSNKMGINQVLCSGGCFSNRVLMEGLNKRLRQQGLCVYWPNRLPPNDAGISLGQAWIAGNLIERDLCV